MQEAARRQYLSLLGIELWLPRGEPDPLAAAPLPGSAAAAAPSAVTGAATDAVTDAVTEPPVPAAARAQLAAMFAGAGTPAVTTTTAPATGQATAPVTAPVVASAPTPARPAAGDEAPAGPVGCSLFADGELLVVAAFLTPRAPGLSGPEYALLANILQALLPGRAMPASDEFSWPPPGVRAPGVDGPGAAREAFSGLLLGYQRRGVRRVVVLGEDLAALLAPVLAHHSLALVPSPSLAAMLAAPEAKRACWQAIRPLRQAPPA